MQFTQIRSRLLLLLINAIFSFIQAHKINEIGKQISITTPVIHVSILTQLS